MARKSIFDIASSSINLPDEVSRIIIMSTKEEILQYSINDYTLFAFVNKFCFRDWEYRNQKTVKYAK